MDLAPGDGVDGVTHRLRTTFPDLPATTVESAVLDSAAAYADARVRTFVPILVERAATQLLRRMPSPRPGDP